MIQAAVKKSRTLRLGGKAVLQAAAGESAAPAVEILAYNGGELPVEGFALPVILDVAGLDVPDQVRPILIDHDDSEEGVLGQTNRIDVDRATGVIKATGVALGVSGKAVRVKQLAASGYQWQASVGALVWDEQLIPAGQTVEVNGRRFSGPVIVGRKSTLREISFVPTGADDTTAAHIAAALSKETAMPTFEEWCASQGFDAATLSEVQRKSMEAMYAAATKPATPATPAVPATATASAAGVGVAEEEEKALEASMKRYRSRLAVEDQRVTLINARLGSHAALKVKAIEEGWDANKIELEALRADRPSAPVGHAGVGGSDVSPRVMEAALCRGAGLKGLEKLGYTDQELSLCDKHFGSRLGIKGFLLECAAKAGKVYRSDSFATHQKAILKAAFSAADVSGIMSNIQQKFLLQGWQSAESTWEVISHIANMVDFKETSFYRLISGGTWEQVGPTGELAHGTLSQDSYTAKLKTFGELIIISREMQINDDLSALADLPKMLGRKAILTLNKEFWTYFLANLTTLFPVDNSKLNYFDGSGSVLQSTSLSTAVQMFRKQLDSENNPLGLDPANLLVPPELEAAADELYTSKNVNTGGAATKEKVPNNNTHAGKYKPAVSSYLSNAAYTGNSSTRWFLTSKTEDAALMRVGFLNGQRNPTVESEDAEIGTLGIATRAFFDFAIALNEYRAGVQSKGAA